MYCRRKKRQEEIDYNLHNSLDLFVFPPAWRSGVVLECYVEAVMHMLGLGVVESNFDLVTKWLSPTPVK